MFVQLSLISWLLQSIDYNKFKRLSNAADEISTKLLPSLLECEVPVAFPDQWFWIFHKTCWKKTPDRWLNIWMQEIEIIDNQNLQKSFQS